MKLSFIRKNGGMVGLATTYEGLKHKILGEVASLQIGLVTTYEGLKQENELGND